MSNRSLLQTQIDLRPLSEAELVVDRDFTPEQVMQHAAGTGSRPDSGTGVAADDDFGVVGPVRFRGTLTRRGDRFTLRGRVTATLQLACGRCLTPFPKVVDTDVDLTYLPEPTPVAPPAKEAKAAKAAKDGKAPKDAKPRRVEEEEVELLDGDLDTSFYQDHVLDLGDMLREQFYLALPMRPLCRVDCQGLCPVCGKDRNVETCQCQTEWVDPRLSGLQALVNRKPDSKSS